MRIRLSGMSEASKKAATAKLTSESPDVFDIWWEYISSPHLEIPMHLVTLFRREERRRREWNNRQGRYARDEADTEQEARSEQVCIADECVG